MTSGIFSYKIKILNIELNIFIFASTHFHAISRGRWIRRSKSHAHFVATVSDGDHTL